MIKIIFISYLNFSILLKSTRPLQKLILNLIFLKTCNLLLTFKADYTKILFFYQIVAKIKNI